MAFTRRFSFWTVSIHLAVLGLTILGLMLGGNREGKGAEIGASASTPYYLVASEPADGGTTEYISDPVFLQFSEKPDVTFDAHGNPQGTTIAAIRVARLGGGARRPVATRFIYDPNDRRLGPDVIGVKFYAVAGARYRIGIAGSATAQNGTPYGGVGAIRVSLPVTPPLPAPIPPGSRSPYFYGVVPQVHFNNAPQIDRWVARLGAGVVRIGTDMESAEPQPGVFNWQSLDAYLAGAYQAGAAADVLIVQYNAPGWANGGSASPPPGAGYIACTPAIYAHFVRAVVHHLLVGTHDPSYPASEVAAIELGNEPDTTSFWQINAADPTCAQFMPSQITTDASAYIRYLRAAYARGRAEADRDGFPNLVFLNAGVATNFADELYFQQIAAAGNHEDAYAIHLYAFADPASPRPTRSWEAFQVLPDDGNIAATYGDPRKHFWVTEGAFAVNSTCPDATDPQTQAYFLTEDFNQMAALTTPVVDAFTYFELQDANPAILPRGADPCFNGGYGIGLVTDRGRRRPAFAAFRALTGK